MDEDQYGRSAIAFDGTWRDFAPIALTNVLLTIVTLGIYRFWATTRERRYLWSRTRFVDERLEWAGTGMELFVGFLLVLVVFGVPYTLLSFVAQSLLLRGEIAAGALLMIASLVAIFDLYGLARYRALRYRLSRSRWRGIRGGSEDPGFGYGLTYMWKSVAGWLPLGLLVPWSMTSLWSDRWNRLSFGPHRFEADPDPVGLMGRYLLFYLSPFIIGFAMVPVFFAMMAAGGLSDGEPNPAFVFLLMLGLFIAIYGVFGLIAMAFYAKYYRTVIGATRWHTLEFEFNARTKDWLILLLGDLGLLIATLGIGYVFLSYRHWKFFITHIEASGEILLDELTQSQTPMAGHGEGLLDAFDIGAI